MKKRKLGAIIVISILIIAIIYFILLPTPIQNIIIPLTEESENETRTPFRFPFTFPWQTSTTQGGGGGGGEGEGGGGGGGGGGEGGEETPSVPQKVNYTLNIDSSPMQFNVRTNYSVNDIIFNIEDVTPYSVEVESDTIACVLLTSDIPGGSIVWWELDGEVCELSLCLGFMGCNILMDKPHTAIIYYKGTEEE